MVAVGNPQVRHYSDTQYRRNQRIVTTSSEICWRCGQSVDRTVHKRHRLAPSADHILPVSRGGTHALANLRLAHVGCNSSRGNRATPRRATASREW
jgi:5-methylcytosine-specific restriction endonuclease McrA